MVSSRFVIFAILFSSIFTGCSVNMKDEANSAFKMFNKDKFYEKALIQTKSSQIINSLETRAKITATYLNKMYPKYSDAEYFLVGVYIVNDDDDPKKAGLNNKNFKLVIDTTDKKTKKIEQIEATVVESLDSDSEIVKKMPLTDSWSRYYIVSFPMQKTEKIVLDYTSEYGKATLRFPKN